MFYIIIKQGVYRHEILGLFDNKDKAIEIAKKNIEKDGYHSFRIAKIELNKEIEDVNEIINVKVIERQCKWSGKKIEIIKEGKIIIENI